MKKMINPFNILSVALNHKEINRESQSITEIKPFINKYKWKKIHFSLEKNVTVAHNVCVLRKKKYILLMHHKKKTQIVKNKLFF